MASKLDRRQMLRLAAGSALGIGTIGVPTPCAAAGSRQAGEAPVTMAMHLHGSFSEGIASMDAHLQQAERVGVDVLWWTDHDFRVAALGYRRGVGFDGPQESENGMSWTWQPITAGTLTTAGHDFVAEPHSPDEEGGALRFRASAPAGGAWATYSLLGQAWNRTYSTSYADTVLELDVLPEQVGTRAQVVVEVVSSYRPATGSRAAGQYRLQYRVGATPGRWTEDGGRLGVIGVAAGTGWQRLRMDLRSDHAALWPDTVAGDAALHDLRVGVRVRDGATVSAVVDRLRFERSRSSVAEGMQLLRSAVRQYRQRYPALTQYAASEVSLVQHLNAFGGDGTLPTYDGTRPTKDGSVQAQQEMVRFLHGHGAVVSINHPPLGGLAGKLVATRGIGADVIEVGTGRSVLDLARAYDVAARNAVFLTANGVTDDHAGVDWLDPAGKRWVTGAWARSRARDDLCDALTAGRAWFFDPLRWNGELDLLVDGHVPMGGVLRTRHRSVPVRVTATRLPKDGSLELVVGRCDRAGVTELAPVNRSTVVPASGIRHGHWSADVRRGQGIYVRAMVRSGSGDVIGFSNPVWVLPEPLIGVVPVPEPRRYRD